MHTVLDKSWMKMDSLESLDEQKMATEYHNDPSSLNQSIN